jgi:predicted RNA binding protein YcfA (HicA-like mRNA interferase family)
MPLSGWELRKIAESLGWRFDRQKGSHIILERGGKIMSIPDHKELKTGTEHKLLKQARSAE